MKIPTPSFFEGYGTTGLAVVLSNAFIGITMNIVYRYADALIKTIAGSLTAIALLVLSSFLFSGRSDVSVYVGATVMLCATYLYFTVGIMETSILHLSARSVPQNAPALGEIILKAKREKDDAILEVDDDIKSSETEKLLLKKETV
jgi:hypothetical protein